MAKVYIPQAVAEEGEAFLLQQGYEIVHGNHPTPEDFAREVADCDAVLLRTLVCSAPLLEAGKKLRIVARHGVGYDNIDTAAAEKLGIWVTNTPQALSDSVAEYTLAAILTAAKKIPQCSRALYAGDYFYKNSHKGMDLSGRTLGIVGFGRIGRALAKKAHFGLDMRILAYSRTLRQEQAPDYVTVCDLDTLLAQSDVVTLHIPGGAANRNLFGTEAFARMKDGAVLVNVARGEVVDEKALLQALDRGKLSFAVLDVQQSEPPQAEDPLLKREDVLLTPHMASNTEECMARMALHAAWQIHKVLSGETPDWPVNHPVQK
ncbi:MAG: hydroxyacid dehydrogenase [Faecousia sp.]